MAALRDRGDERAFAVLYERHAPAMYGLALRQLGGDAATAEDVVHDAWIRGVERLGSFRGESSLRTWLNGFVVRLAWESQRISFDELDANAAEPAEAHDPGALAADRMDLERAIAALPNGFRQVLVLHDVEGHTHEEIATLLGIVPGTSKSQLSRARSILRRALTQGG